MWKEQEHIVVFCKAQYELYFEQDTHLFPRQMTSCNANQKDRKQIMICGDLRETLYYELASCTRLH